jgi:hypothetical protein
MPIAPSTLGRYLRRSLFLPLFLLALGCGSKGTITGKVTFKGAAVPGGQVRFLAQNGKSYSGDINEDGTYTVKNVPTGPAKVSVVPNEPPATPGGGRPGPPFGGPPKDRKIQFGPPKDANVPEEVKKGFDPTKTGQKFVKGFPAKYKDPEKSELTHSVTSGEQTYDIPLK